MVIFTICFCHRTSLQYTHIINLWCVANRHCECLELKPKIQSNSSFLVLQLSLGLDTVNTVGSHLQYYSMLCMLLSRIILSITVL